MAPSSPVPIPATAHCVHGPQHWTMSHPQPGRLELSFPFVANVTVREWWVLNVLFGLVFLLYAAASWWLLWGPFSWYRVGFFLAISAIFWPGFLDKHPLDRMIIQELVIDKSTDMITAKGLVHGRSVVVNVPMPAVTEVKYWKGLITATGSKPSQIEILLAQPHRTMRFPDLANRDEGLYSWICTILGKPIAL